MKKEERRNPDEALETLKETIKESLRKTLEEVKRDGEVKGAQGMYLRFLLYKNEVEAKVSEEAAAHFDKLQKLMEQYLENLRIRG